MTASPGNTGGFQVPLRTALVLGSGGLMLLAVAIALFLGYRGAREATTELLSSQADAIINDLAGVLEAKLDPVLDQAIWIADEFGSGRIDFKNSDQLDAFMRGTLAATPEVGGLGLYSADYQHRRFLRSKENVERRDRSADPDIKELIIDISDERGASWGDPVWVDDVGETIINLRTPLFRDGQFLGVLIQGISIADLSRTLSAAVDDEEFIQFALYDGVWVLAHPVLAHARLPFSDAKPLPALKTFGDEVLAEIWSVERKPLEFIRSGAAVTGHAVVIGKLEYVFLYETLHRYADKPLTLGVYFNHQLVDESDEVIRLRRMILVGIGILVVSVAAALMAGRAIGHPILRLSEAARTIKGGNLDRFQPLPRTAFREITDASLSFNAMVEGLKERNLVRGLLGKYVPEDVARSLIKERGVVEPISTEATVMFTDIAGFTTISESLSPGEMVDMLNEYFTLLSGILEDHGGVIAQFQGDGLLAMFNVPVADPGHAAEAVRAALEIQRAVSARPFAGHALSCRIGLATGEVIAGSVGASDRLTFTVYGDTVNLASRLEQMNKELGTEILVHQRTVELAGAFPFESRGEVTVRGRVEPVTLYTVKAETAAGSTGG